MLRIRSAARSPRERSSPDRTPGCLCQWLCHLVFSMGRSLHSSLEERDGAEESAGSGSERRFVVGAKGHAASSSVRAHAQDLVDLQVTSFETDGRPGHVELPDPSALRTYLVDRLVEPFCEIVHPVAQCEGVVLTQTFHVAHLE